jgi:CRP-like cAMP-binding protein
MTEGGGLLVTRNESLKYSLAQADLFYEWDDLLLELVASICLEKVYHEGEMVFDENSQGEELYIISEGKVEIRVRIGTDPSAQYITIAVLRRGQNFGEVSLLDAGRRTAAAVIAESNTRLIIIPRDKLMVMCENVPRLGYYLMRNLATDLALKIRSTDQDIREQLTWVPVNQS